MTGTGGAGGRRWRRVAAVTGAAAATVGVAVWWWAAPVAVRPGPALDVWTSAGVSRPPGSGALLAPTVTVRSAGLPTLLSCWSDADCHVYRGRTGAGGGDDAAAYVAAAAAAETLTGRPVPVAAGPADVSGGSAALAYAVALSAAATGTSTGAAPVAVTGMLDAAGQVLPVAAEPVKTASAAAGGAQLMLAPAAAAPGPPPVVAVSSLADVWRVLCSRGGQGPLCQSGQVRR